MKSKYPKASRIPIIWDSFCNNYSKPLTHSEWAAQLSKTWLRTPKKSLDQGVRLLAAHSPATPPALTAPNQPFDSQLLALSRLYVRSRNLFIQSQGAYRPSMNSSPRSLGSLALLEPIIEYSPISAEYIWAATDPRQRQNKAYLSQLRSLISNLFHEQNHRILWHLLPNAPKKPGAMRRYLNFAESLVITLDMALSYEIDYPLNSLFHLCGVTYDRGATVHPLRESLKHAESTRKRIYRNYLQACVYSTYLYLELYEPKDILRATQTRFNAHEPIGTLAAERSLLLDSEFVKKTNPFWQSKNGRQASLRLQQRPGEPLELSDDPENPYLLYLWAEKWFEQMGL